MRQYKLYGFIADNWKKNLRSVSTSTPLNLKPQTHRCKIWEDNKLIPYVLLIASVVRTSLFVTVHCVDYGRQLIRYDGIGLYNCMNFIRYLEEWVRSEFYIDYTVLNFGLFLIILVVRYVDVHSTVSIQQFHTAVAYPFITLKKYSYDPITKEVLIGAVANKPPPAILVFATGSVDRVTSVAYPA